MTLEAKDISVRLGKAQILDGVSVSFRRGQISAIIGPNGAGKSTLLDCLAALRTPDNGTAMLDGVCVHDTAPRVRSRKIGYLPQVQDVHWDVNVRSLVALGRFPHRGSFAGESDHDRSAIETAMHDMDVSQFAQRCVQSLSGGERARVLMARVLAGEPEWLLADEPLASLDIAHQLDMLSALRKAATAKNIGVVMVLHDLSHAMNHADHAVMLSNGRIAASGKPDRALSADHIENTYSVKAAWIRTQDGKKYLSANARSIDGKPTRKL